MLWSNQIVINDFDDLTDTEEILKVQKVLEKNIPIIKNKVVAEDGTYLGYVMDFAMNPKLFVLTKILVSKSILGLFPYQEKLIAHQNIVEIKKDEIIVKNLRGLIPVKEKKESEEKTKLRIEISPSIIEGSSKP